MNKINVPTNIADYLTPGVSVPQVKDLNGVTVTTAAKITNNSVLVDIGSAPNSNTGDPVRLAFVKYNNLTEAVYQYSNATELKLGGYDSDLYDPVNGITNVIDGGIF